MNDKQDDTDRCTAKMSKAMNTFKSSLLSCQLSKSSTFVVGSFDYGISDPCECSVHINREYASSVFIRTRFTNRKAP